MPIRKDGDGRIQYTPRSDRFDSGMETGVEPSDTFAIADSVDQLKQIKFDASAQGTNSNVVIKTGAVAADSTVTITLPSTSLTLGPVASFTTVQTPAGTSPVATSTDTLTLTSSDSSVTITGNATTDTINFATRYSNPGTGTESEVFGASALAGSNGTKACVFGEAAESYSQNSVVIGNGAIAGQSGVSTYNDHIVIGEGALATGFDQGSVAIGRMATANRGNGTGGGVAVGANAAANGTSCVAIGYSANVSIVRESAIALGAFATATADNQLVIGAAQAPITDVVMGATKLKNDSSGHLQKGMGTGTGFATLGGLASVDTTAVGNTGTGEDDLMSYSLPAASLAANGDHIEVDAWGSYGATGNNKTVKLYFGATAVYSSGVVTTNDGRWRIQAKIVRTGATAQISVASIADIQTAAPAETLSGAVTVKCTGEGTDDNDVRQLGMIIKYQQV